MNFGIGNGFTKIQVKFVNKPNPMYNYAMATLLRQSQAFSVPLPLLAGNVFGAAAFTIAARWCWRAECVERGGIHTKEETKKP